MKRMDQARIDAVLEYIKSKENPDGGNHRVKEVVNRVLKDLFNTIADLDITSEEMWHACDFLGQIGRNGEWGLVFAGTGIEHFLDTKMDWEDEQAGIHAKTPRTIEGPLYVAGAPVFDSYAELETVPEPDAERLYMGGTVLDEDGNPVAGAKVEIWHCNLKGLYSYFDSTQPPFNLRRGIITGNDGKYEFKSFVPVGYSCPPGGSTDTLMSLLGRHGSRPAHIHFFVSAPGYRKLTTQINIEGDPLTYDDFAFATRDDLVPHIERIPAARAVEYGKSEPFAKIDFDFNLVTEKADIPAGENNRSHAQA